MNIDPQQGINRIILALLQRYDHSLYWKMRNKVTDTENRTWKYIKLFYLLLIKWIDAFNNASMGTDLNRGAKFSTPPILPHGLNGIIISHHAIVGKNCKIYQQVTIGDDGKRRENAPNIGDNCVLGAGAKIIGKISIGNNVKIGAGCVVWFDVPDNATVVFKEPRIILK